MLLVKRKRNQIIGWVKDNDIADQYIGTFENKFPERCLFVKVSTERDEFDSNVEEFSLSFWIDPNCDLEFGGGIEVDNESGTHALFHLNPRRLPSRIFNIPYLEDLGFPLKKATPMFMLGLVEYLDSHEWDIPEDERIQIKPFTRNLIDYSIEILFSPEILENTEIMYVLRGFGRKRRSQQERLSNPDEIIHPQFVSAAGGAKPLFSV
jgi:hypothetical protein